MSEDRPIEFLQHPPIPRPRKRLAPRPRTPRCRDRLPQASLVAGYGDPQGARPDYPGDRAQPAPRSRSTATTSPSGGHHADVLYPAGTPRFRCAGGAGPKRRLVVSVGGNDIAAGVNLARHQLGLANLLDDATSAGVRPFVVSPPPSGSAEVNGKLEVLLGPSPTSAPDAGCRLWTASPRCSDMTSGRAIWPRAMATTRGRPATD